MDSTGSLLKTILTRVRAYLDEVDLDAKYTDSFILQNYVTPSMVDVLARLNLNADNPVICKLTVTLVDQVYDYPLPPCIQTIMRLVSEDAQGNVVQDFKPQSNFHWAGKGWAIERNILSFSPPPYGYGMTPSTNTLLRLWYVSNGDVAMHYSTTGGTLALNSTTGKHEFTLDLSPALGMVDRRTNGYAGCTLRLLPTAANTPCEERVIESSSWSGSAWKVVLRNLCTDISVGATLIPYEITPPFAESMAEAVACSAAMRVGTARKITQQHNQSIHLQYRSAMKTIGDNLALIQSRTFKRAEKATIDRGWGPLND